jgi:eukaryotic-like serine/threonine-protein kinase
MLAEITPGLVLAGKYEIERVLGRGGMGFVVAARHLQLDERVAIKFLLPEANSIPEVVARFAREARAAVRIKSEHVARVSDVGTLEQGAPYMVMEYLEGADLAELLRRDGALPAELAVEFVLQACEAIAEAHALGIVHRDLKPANLFVVRRADGLLSVKVLDFGISKVASATGPAEVALTRTAAVMGSPLYMPPEQMAASRDVDHRADIWALGAILYELLTARPPFLGETLPEVCVRIATEPPLPLASSRSDIPAALERVVLRCLEKDRERRFANLGELAVALRPFGPPRAHVSIDRVLRTLQAAGLSTSALASSEPPARSGSVPATTAGTLTDASWGNTTPPHARNRRRWMIGAAVGLAGLAAVAFVLAQSSSWLGPGDGAASAAPSTSPSVAPTNPALPPASVAPATAAATAAPVVAPVPSLAASAPTAEAPPAARGPLPSKRSVKRAGTAPSSRPAAEPARKGSVFDDR